nr:hypothetical protein [Tanacetum cinerariifolium]
SLGDKIICDLDQTPDLSQRSPQNCPNIEHGILQDSSKPSNDNTNFVNAPREPFVGNQDPGKNSSQNPPQINHHCCYGCGDPLEGEKQIEEEQAAHARYWKIPACYNDDDDDDYNFVITPNEPVNSLKSLRNHDSSIIISSNIDSLFDEFAGELTLLKSIPPGIDETDCNPEEETHFIKRLLYDNSSPRPLEEFIFDNSDAVIESFSPSPIPIEDSDSLMEEIDLSFTLDYPMPQGIEEDDYDSERDILISKDLLSNDSISLL